MESGREEGGRVERMKGREEREVDEGEGRVREKEGREGKISQVLVS